MSSMWQFFWLVNFVFIFVFNVIFVIFLHLSIFVLSMLAMGAEI
jgi:hypothetical protein